MYLYKSPVGDIYICRNSDGYGIYFGGICYSGCPTAEACADDVYTQSTGIDVWDQYIPLPGEDIPSDLSGWTFIRRPLR